LREAHVQLHRVQSDQPTGTAFICVSDDAENAITVAPGANGSLAPHHLPDLHGYSHLLMQLEIPIAAVTAYAHAAHRQGVRVVLNAAPMQTLPAELLELIDILVVNEGELASLVGASATVAQGLERIAHIPTVVVTLGARGCCARSQGAFHLQSAFPVAPLDTTAAGDTFCGALVAALSLGADLPHALARGCAAGALACTRMGAQTSIPLQTEVSHFLAQQEAADDATMRDLRAYCGLPD
jgi:ribokinase